MAEPPKPVDPQQPVEEEEVYRRHPSSDPENSWLEPPAVYCDTFSTSTLRRTQMVRMVFGDYVGKGFRPFYRSAIVMPLSDIKALHRHLTRSIAILERNDPEPADDDNED